MAKALTQSDIAAKAERWATHAKKIEAIEAEREQELSPLKAACERKMGPINDRYDALVDPLQTKADELEIEIVTWLEGQKKAIRIESKRAIAELIKGTKFGNRQPDPAKYVATCQARKIPNFWAAVKVVLKEAEQILGKKDLEDICEKPKIDYADASLRLKN